MVNCQYDKTMLIGDFNLTIDNKDLEFFMNIFNLEYLRNKSSSSQSENPPCVDLTLTSMKELFIYSEVIQVGISDHHSFVITSLKSQLVRGNKKKTKIYSDYSKFNMNTFKDR